MKAYSQDLRDRVIDLYFNKGWKRQKIGELLSISYNTVCNWIKRFKSTGKCESFQHLNPGKICHYTDKKAILEYLESNEDASGKDIRNALCASIPMSTFYDTLHRMQITYKKRAKI